MIRAEFADYELSNAGGERKLTAKGRERVKPEEREEEEEGRTMFFEKLQWKLLRRVAAGDLNKRTSGHQCLGLAVARRLASESQSNNNGVTRGCTLLPCCAVFCFNPGDCRGINHEATAQSQHLQWADEHKAGATTGPEPRIRPTSESRGSCTWVCATRLANGSHPVNSIQAERIIGYCHALYRRTTSRGKEACLVH
ncbi:hypothetical protein ASPVEDRAFT_512838 [Aspergillus versicolor CBS 583.65]|uniref:Uncharacterized protein n=1 Tax=Aspergillus versicolor CBS 583.65 TaxID=1036611 RepID=A0A1L9PD20_ASPVE|nr:uncharacterized protein ASPVEDRAFT_512838 [Aspergillus versicolor CBS 583.65]OJI99391.1 hypothetical protein ASPVEDRAFT_512838 [Aspergillus versicolor CBS 583.65]